MLSKISQKKFDFTFLVAMLVIVTVSLMVLTSACGAQNPQHVVVVEATSEMSEIEKVEQAKEEAREDAPPHFTVEYHLIETYSGDVLCVMGYDREIAIDMKCVALE